MQEKLSYEQFNDFMNITPNYPEEWEDWMHDIFYNHLKDCHYLKGYNNYLKKKKPNHYLYMMTFTYDKKKYPSPPVDQIENYLKNISKRQEALGIIYYGYTKEHHKDGTPHWHAIICTNKYLKTNRFAQYTKSYGIMRVEKNQKSGTSPQGIYDYITKESQLNIIIDFNNILAQLALG